MREERMIPIVCFRKEKRQPGKKYKKRVRMGEH